MNLASTWNSGALLVVLSGAAGVKTDRDGESVKFLDKNDYFQKGLDEKSAELLFWVKSVAKGHGQEAELSAAWALGTRATLYPAQDGIILRGGCVKGVPYRGR